jgi:DNA-binding beta-propeller fold protein YncE/uncharacterized membrane protein
MDSFLYTLFTFLHILGAIIGAGGAFVSDFVFFKSHKDKIISKDEFTIIEGLSSVVWGGLLILVVSGGVLFGMNHEVLLASDAFLAKITLVLFIIVNGFFFHYLHIPYIHKHLEHHLFPKKTRSNKSDFLIFSGVVSFVSWVSVLTIASLKHYIPLGYLGYLAVYALALACGSLVARVAMKKTAHHEELETLRKASFIFGALALLIALFLIFTVSPSVPPTQSEETSENMPAFTAAQVHEHATPDDCWIIVDDQVFDVTKVAAHSGAFHCGEDVSKNYHRNHGPVVRPQLLAFKIGNLSSESSVEESTPTSSENISPKVDVLHASTSYKVADVMVVVEKSNNSLLVIDGATHTPLARLHDIGFQPHGVVFSSDLTFGYSISRDGWLIEFSLSPLEVTRWIRVGESSRGIALSDDDTYLALGNYEPETIVIVDTTTLTSTISIPLKEGDQTSRAGALVEKGNLFIVTLKDLNSVWVVDPSQPQNPVQEKYRNIGGSPSLLHDGFLTPDGKFFITAAQDTDVVWVLDTSTWEEVARVTTGKKPHTGPGAFAYNTVYIPSLEEGITTAITYDTWEVASYIAVDGPGLFVRSYNKDPEYPYIWGDTAFYEGADTIYIVDARDQSIVKELTPTPGKMSIHPEFTYDGSAVYISGAQADEIIIYDAQTFEEISRIPSFEPTGVFNAGLRIDEPGL